MLAVEEVTLGTRDEELAAVTVPATVSLRKRRGDVIGVYCMGVGVELSAIVLSAVTLLQESALFQVLERSADLPLLEISRLKTDCSVFSLARI